MPRLFLVALLVAVTGTGSSLWAQQQTHGYVEFEPIDTVTVMAAHTVPLQFTFRIKPGYHINSSKPLTEELIPTSLGLIPPPDMVIAKVQYPAGELTSFPFDPTQKLSVYSGDVVIKAALITQPNAVPGTYTVRGEFKYQACDNNACYPPKKLPLQFDVKVEKKERSTQPRRQEKIR